MYLSSLLSGFLQWWSPLEDGLGADDAGVVMAKGRSSLEAQVIAAYDVYHVGLVTNLLND